GAEEVEALEDLGLASRVIPGVSSMQTAASSTGILLTRRGVSRGFSVMTPRLQAGKIAPVTPSARAELPIIFFMSIEIAEKLAAELISGGLPPETPCAFIFGAGSDRETTIRPTLNQLPDIDPALRELAGLFIVGDITRYGFHPELGALGGKSILLTCSGALMDSAIQSVRDFGGKPVVRPLIRLVTRPDAVRILSRLADFDWIALTSPSAVRCFYELLVKEKIDLRRRPRIMSVGSGSTRALQKIGLGCDLQPDRDFSAKGLLEVATPHIQDQTVLRLRSEKAGEELSIGLRAAGANVTDCILYENQMIQYDRCPEFDAAFFASASAVESFLTQWGAEALNGKITLALGEPTRFALNVAGCEPTITGTMATTEKSLFELARYVCLSNITAG
ncbi:MAG: hypothetical protein FJ220_07645, partial [Kiritimatiellaceae bacterium]|nr:hypothetical protein [Kiritimatiellaceae bacterium]